MNRLLEKYNNSVRTELANKFAYKSSMQIPRLEKIVINMGVGDAVANSKVLEGGKYGRNNGNLCFREF